MFYLGIDIAKVNHVASLIDEHGSILVKAIKFTNSNEGLQKLLDAISNFDLSQIYCAMVNQIIFLENQVNELDLKIKDIYSKLDSHLESIPGIGKVTAPIILAEIGDINNFSSPSKLNAFAGIDL